MGIPAGDKEQDIIKMSLDYLKLRRWPEPIRVNAGAAHVEGPDGKRRRIRLAPAGTADYLGIVPQSGRLLALEFKRAKGGRISAHQHAFLRVVRTHGGVALLVNDLSVLQQAVDTLESDPFRELNFDGTSYS